MKFGKKLRATVNNSYEEWRPMFMSYKDLKKCLANKPLTNEHGGTDYDSKDSDCKDEESVVLETPLAPVEDSPDIKQANFHAVKHAENINTKFFTIFKQQVDKVNDFFLDKQEDFIIEHRQLSEKVADCLKPGSATRIEVVRLKQRLTNFHGELVLLENFSTVNYTGFRKILKKHDKKTGLHMQTVYLKTVLVTPFFLSDTVRKLVLKTEAQLEQLDGIAKFRKPNSSPTLSLEAPATHVTQLCSTPTRSQHQLSPPLLSELPLSTLPITPAPIIVVEPPRPHAFISPRSALWRLYSEGRAFAQLSSLAKLQGNPSQTRPLPPQSLLDLVDSISPNELGLHQQFLQSVVNSSNYCIAGDENFSMGFFVVTPNVKLQIFQVSPGSTFISKNLRGSVKMAVYQTTTTESASTEPSEHGVAGDVLVENDDFCVKQKRSALTVGPWPAVTCSSPDVHVEWVPESVCAIFYVCTPALVNERMPIYDLQPRTPSTFRVVRHLDHHQDFARIIC